jgi:hypothetical protein
MAEILFTVALNAITLFYSSSIIMLIMIHVFKMRFLSWRGVLDTTLCDTYYNVGGWIEKKLAFKYD